LALLGLAPCASLAELEAQGIPLRAALAGLLAEPPPVPTAGLALARRAAALAQGRPELFGLLGELLGRAGVHPLSMLNWAGWEPDRALALLQEHWRGPGRAPLALVGLGRVAAAGLFCGGDLVLADLPRLAGWGEAIRIGGDLVLSGVPRRAAPPPDLQVAGRRRLPAEWDAGLGGWVRRLQASNSEGRSW